MIQYKNKKRNTKPLTFINACLIVTIVVSYLMQLALLNHAANQRYVYAGLLSEFGDMESQVRSLSARSAELQSTGRLAQESTRLNLIAADSVHYVRPIQPVVLNK